MRARWLLAFLATVVACGEGTGGDTVVSPPTEVTTTTAATTTAPLPEDGFVVTSEDGDLTVSVPAAAIAADPGIGVRRLAPGEYPPELASAADDPEARVYELEPTGLQFDAPVTVTRRIDTSRFGDLGPSDVPVILLVTRAPDGTWELLGDVEVVRAGGDLFVSGTTTHFSPVAALRESPTAVMTIDRESLETIPTGRSLADVIELATEAPGSIALGVHLRGIDGSRRDDLSIRFLDGTAGALSVDGAAARIDCRDLADVEVLTLGASAVFGSDALAGVVSLITAPDPIEVRFRLATRYSCLDPVTSIIGTPLTGFGVASDHPGGRVWIPGEDFRGGLSAAYAWMRQTPRLDTAWIGLIGDGDGDGLIGAGDTMFRPFPAMANPPYTEWVLPLTAYGGYFLYAVDGGQYSGVPTGDRWTLPQGLAAWEMRYTGMGRFESSLGFLGIAGAPLDYRVDADEGPQEPEAAPQITMFPLEYLGRF